MAVTAALALFLASPDADAQQTGSGIFTEQQATAGKKVYEDRCGSCHGTNLAGGSASALIGPAFAARWGGKVTTGSAVWSGFHVDDLLAAIANTMPPTAVEKVSAADKLSILAYLLQQNGFATGSNALNADSAALHDTTLAFLPRAVNLEPEQRVLVWVDRQGREQRVPAPPREYYLPRLSPDGKQVAVEVHLDKPDIWIVNLATGDMRQLTHEGSNRFPLWSPDGSRVLYASDRYRQPVNGKRVSHAEGHEVYWQAADGSGTAERLTFGEPPLGPYPHAPQKWTPDGKTLSIYEIHPTNKRDIWMLPFDGDRRPWPFLATPHAEAGVAFSKDGKWLAYTSDETGRYEIMMRGYPAAVPKQQITTDGGLELLWPLGSKELFYRSGKKRMALEVTAGTTVKVGTPHLLFEGDYVNSTETRAGWDSLDGQRFLLVKALDGSAKAKRATAGEN